MIDPNAPSKSQSSLERTTVAPSLWEKYRPHIISAVLLIVLGGIAIALNNSGGEQRRASEPMEIRDR